MAQSVTSSQIRAICLTWFERQIISVKELQHLSRLSEWFQLIMCYVLSLVQVILVRSLGKRSRDLSKTDMVDVDQVLSQSKAKRSQMSSSLSSINGLSRSALHVQNHGNLVKTSLAFHQQQHSQHSQHSLQVEQHHNHSQVQHQYYGDSQPHLYTPGNHHIFSDHYFDHSNHSLSQMNQIEYSPCPPMTFTGNGWV